MVCSRPIHVASLSNWRKPFIFPYLALETICIQSVSCQRKQQHQSLWQGQQIRMCIYPAPTGVLRRRHCQSRGQDRISLIFNLQRPNVLISTVTLILTSGSNGQSMEQTRLKYGKAVRISTARKWPTRPDGRNGLHLPRSGQPTGQGNGSDLDQTKLSNLDIFMAIVTEDNSSNTLVDLVHGNNI